MMAGDRVHPLRDLPEGGSTNEMHGATHAALGALYSCGHRIGLEIVS